MSETRMFNIIKQVIQAKNENVGGVRTCRRLQCIAPDPAQPCTQGRPCPGSSWKTRPALTQVNYQETREQMNCKWYIWHNWEMENARTRIMRSEVQRTGCDEMIRELRSSTSPETQMHKWVVAAALAAWTLLTRKDSALARTEDAFEKTIFVFGGPLARVGTAYHDCAPQSSWAQRYYRLTVLLRVWSTSHRTHPSTPHIHMWAWSQVCPSFALSYTQQNANAQRTICRCWVRRCPRRSSRCLGSAADAVPATP